MIGQCGVVRVQCALETVVVGRRIKERRKHRRTPGPAGPYHIVTVIVAVCLLPAFISLFWASPPCAVNKPRPAQSDCVMCRSTNPWWKRIKAACRRAMSSIHCTGNWINEVGNFQKTVPKSPENKFKSVLHGAVV